MSLPPPKSVVVYDRLERRCILFKGWFDSSNFNLIISSSNLESNSTVCKYMRDAIRSFLLHF
jgi:hypothetical protein